MMNPLRLSAFIILVAAPLRAQSSDSNFAIRFSGTGDLLTDRVTIQIDDNAGGPGASTPADLGAGSFTIEFWVRGELADNPAAAQTPGSHSSNLWINGNIVLDRDIWAADGSHPDANRDFGISFANGRVMFGTGFNGNDAEPDGEHTLVGAVNVLDGQWRHLACVRDVRDGSKSIYLDGALDTTAAGVSDDDLSYPDAGVAINPGSSCDCNHFLVLGAEKHDAGPALPAFSGYFDELRLWKAALPPECLQIYRHRVLVNPTPGRGPVDGFPDLVGMWRFEEGSGTTAADTSGGTAGIGNNAASVIDGTVGNAQWVSRADDPHNTAPVASGTDFGGPVTGRVLVGGLSLPLFVASPPGDLDRIFIVEQRDGGNTGRIKVFKKSTGQLNAADFLSVPNVNDENEEGLLGFAFHPDFATNGFVYVYYSFGGSAARRSVVQRYTESTKHPGGLDDPDRVDPESALAIIEFSQPQSNHNGGWMGFRQGDAGNHLYISSGDGGGGDDTGTGHTTGIGNAQDITNNLLGKILRLDIDDDDFPADASRNYAIPPANRFVGITGDDEIWLYGLRNPWRCSFDRLTGDFWCADVGQNAREELNFRPAGAGDSDDGNYGWRLREGFIATPTVGGPRPPGNVDPILDFVRSQGSTTNVINGHLYGRSVTGGYVYRGPQAGMQGLYFFGDAITDKIWSMRYRDGIVTELTERTANLVTGVISSPQITSFGEDAEGNLYYCSRNGDIAQILVEDPWHAWRNEHFSTAELADPTVSGPGGNGDGDALTAIEEFVTGGDPHAPDVALDVQPGRVTIGPDEFYTFAIPRDPQSAGVVTLTGQTAGDLLDFANIDPSQVLDDTPTLFRFRDSVPVSDARFRAARVGFDLQP